MAIKKMKNKDGTTVWEVYALTQGKGSRRVRRRFQRRIDAENFLKQKEKNLLEASVINEMSQLIDLWLEDAKLRFSPGHLRGVNSLLNLVRPHIDIMKPMHINIGFMTLLQKKMKATGIRNSTVNRRTELVMAILNFGVRMQYLPFHPARGFRKLPKDHREMQFWTKREALDFLGCMNGRYPKGAEGRWRFVVYLLAINCGLRAGEIWGLQVADLVPENGLLSVRRQYHKDSKDFRHTKGKCARVVPLSDQLLSELQGLCRNCLPKTPIFRNQVGNPICHDNFNDRVFAKDLKVWGGTRIRFHDLRHTSITLMIASGVDIKTVKEIAGHREVSTTMNYVHLVGEKIRSAADKYQLKLS